MYRAVLSDGSLVAESADLQSLAAYVRATLAGTGEDAVVWLGRRVAAVIRDPMEV